MALSGLDSPKGRPRLPARLAVHVGHPASFVCPSGEPCHELVLCCRHTGWSLPSHDRTRVRWLLLCLRCLFVSVELSILLVEAFLAGRRRQRSRDRNESRGRRRRTGMTGLHPCVGPPAAEVTRSTSAERPAGQRGRLGRQNGVNMTATVVMSEDDR